MLLSKNCGRAFVGVVVAILTGGIASGQSDASAGRAAPVSSQAMNPPQIMHRESFLVMGTVTRRNPKTDRPEMFASIWSEFETRHEAIKPHSVDLKYYGVSFAKDADGGFEYLAAMAVSPVEDIPEGLQLRELPAATYAVFATPVQFIGETYRYIFGEWCTQSGYIVDDATPAFEEYPPATETNAPVRIHIPIRKERAP